jgi:tRNA(Ile)-lysidine synthase
VSKLAASVDAAALRSAVIELIGEPAAADDRFGVAVSGGPDSVALLLLAHAAFGDHIAAATVDHRLRPEAADECAYVAALCADHGIAHHILTAPSPPNPANQAGARKLRYALLDQWMAKQQLDWLLTGHHADDQLETLIMRLNRRSGIAGLTSIRSRHEKVLRPLLHWTRAELRAVVDAAGLNPVDDPSNRDPHFDRVRVRAALKQTALFDPRAVSESLAHLATAEDALLWTTQRLIAERVITDGADICLDTVDLPLEFCQRVTLHILSQDAESPPRGGEVAQLISRVAAGEVATLAGWRVAPNAAQPMLWHFRRAAPRRNHA